MEVPLKGLAAKVVQDNSGEIKASGKWPLIIDPSGLAITFLKYQELNHWVAVDMLGMPEDTIRKTILGALRYGKGIMIDVADLDLLDSIAKKFNGTHAGLWEALISQSIRKPEVYEKMIKSHDGEDLRENRFVPEYTENFKLFFITSLEDPPANLKAITFPVVIKTN